MESAWSTKIPEYISNDAWDNNMLLILPFTCIKYLGCITVECFISPNSNSVNRYKTISQVTSNNPYM